MSRLFLYLVVLTLFFTTLSLSAQAVTVKTIRGASADGKTRLVLELDTLTDFRADTMADPPALVVELPAQSITDRAGMGLAPLGITGVKHTRQNNLMQIAFAMKAPVKITSAFMLEKDAQKPNRLVIDYRPCTDDCGKGASVGNLPGPVTSVSKQPSETASTGAGASPAPPSDKNTPGPGNDIGRTYTIVIDAGHGGKDPGAIGVNRLYEKNITLSAARQLAELLSESQKYRVMMTRSTDRFILLHDRVRIAHAEGADLFISLHADMAPDNRYAQGLSIYTLSDKASDEQTEKLAARENKVDLIAGVDLSNTQEDVANILIDLAMRENMNQSRFLAGKVVASMSGNGVELIDKPHRYAGFAVLKAPDIPSVLVEMGFLSNPTESRRLQDPVYRQRLMSALKNGIDAYFKVIEKR